MNRPDYAVVAVLTCYVLCVVFRPDAVAAAGDEPGIPPGSAEDSGRDISALTQEAGAIEIKADKLNYFSRNNWIEASGHVVARKGNDELHADYVRVNMKTEDAYAFGNVMLKRAGEVWRGRSLYYNFRTKTGDAANLTCNAEPFRLIQSDKAEKAGSEYILYDAVITTCTNKYPHCHYNIKAHKVRILPGEYIKAHGGIWRFGRLPVMYMPYWYRNLRENFGFRFYPGYNSRMGAFLLSSYRYRLNPSLRAQTHVDYRSKRGFAVGEDFKWLAPQGEWWGDMSLYYADDKEPLDEDDDPATADIDNNRYRIRIKHDHNFSDRNYMLSQVHYLSDTDILEDFFEDEYRESTQPENYLIYSHRGDGFTANLMLQGRLNDFYSNVNRLPECSLDFMRQEIGNSSLYYEGQTAASFLEKVWEESNTNKQDYSVFRVDSSHMIYRPAKHFGFLNVIPRAGYRGTYYSKTRNTVITLETTTTAETNVQVDAFGNTNTVVTAVTQTNSLSQEVETGNEFRSRVELGMETSFKMFKTWYHQGGGFRHVAEPYANYTFVPEPTLLPERIYQFDEVDTLVEEHWTQFGVRNKFQTKKNGRPFDLVDVDVYTIYKIEREADEEALPSIFLDAELQPHTGLKIDLDAEFDTEESKIETFNSLVSVSPPDFWRAGMEYRFNEGESSLLSGSLTLLPNRNWTFEIYGRYEFEDKRLEEEWGYIQRNFDCMALRTGVGLMPGYTTSGGSEIEDEWRFTIEFWLTAFPEAGLAGKHRN